MMIPILTDYYKDGYLPSPGQETLFAFFPNCNLSVRKKALEGAGFYDKDYKFAAEDADVCRRISHAGWKLFYEPKAVCYHEPRKNIWSLVRQWLAYGYYSALLFKKHQKAKCEIFISFEPKPRIHKYAPLFTTKKFPFRVLIFLSYFPLFHLLSLFILLSIGMRLFPLTAFLSLLLTAYFLALYFRNPATRRLRLKDLALYIYITYMINISCILGSFIGGLKQRMLYIYSGL